MPSNPYARRVIPASRRVYFRAVGDRKLYLGVFAGLGTPMVHPGQEGVMDRENPAHMAILAQWVEQGRAVAFEDINEAQWKVSGPWQLHQRELARAAEPAEAFSYIPLADITATSSKGAVGRYTAGSIYRWPTDPDLQVAFQQWIADEKMLQHHPRLDGALREGWLAEVRAEADAANLAAEEAARLTAEEAERVRLLQETEAAELTAKEAVAEAARDAAARRDTAEATARAAVRSSAR